MQKQEHLLGSQHAGVSHSQVETPKYKFILLLYIGMGSCVERAVRRAELAMCRVGRVHNGPCAEQNGLCADWALHRTDCAQTGPCADQAQI